MATPTHNEIIDENCSLDRTPSGRFITRSRPSSFRTISMEPISPTGPPTGMNSFRMPPMRTRSLKRNRYEKIMCWQFLVQADLDSEQPVPKTASSAYTWFFF